MKKKKTKALRESCRTNKNKATLTRHFTVQLKQVPMRAFEPHNQPSSASAAAKPPRFQTLLDCEASAEAPQQPQLLSSGDGDGGDSQVADDKDFILSQDFFCTADYITPDDQNLFKTLDCNKENIPCPKSPDKLNTLKSKRRRTDKVFGDSFASTLPCHGQAVSLVEDTIEASEVEIDTTMETGSPKKKNYVSQSAVALRCRVMPPPCLKNPYLQDVSGFDSDPFGYQRSKCAGFLQTNVGGDGLSRYHTDFHEIEQIGFGNFSCVFKVLKRLDGCLYAVKYRMRKLCQDSERRMALMEVQALAALGFHENIVGYYSSWYENEQLYIQMELCDHSLSIQKADQPFTEAEALKAMHQIAKALQFIHEKQIAHLDVKPDNIYVKGGVYKLGDFGCATLLDRSLPIEEGDARYMPQEILNENYDHLDKVDIFSLGMAIYELVRGSPLPDSGPRTSNLKEGKLPLLPSYSLQFQNLIKVMLDPDPLRRPCAGEIVENPIFSRSNVTKK